MTPPPTDQGRSSPNGSERYGIPAPGYRLPATTRVGGVRLQVADLGRSLTFYGDVLGLRVLEGVGRHATLGPADAAEPLIELHERPGAAPAPPRGRPGLYHYAILLPGRAALGSFMRHLSDAGIRAGAADHRVSEALYLHDPDGLGIEVYADRPRDAWRRREGQLVMSTDPLDVGDLLAAAGTASWTGMPDGAAVGHLHLHVGDLEEAAAFYHVALGLDKTVWSYPGALFLSAGGYHHHLGLNTWAADPRPAGESDARLVEWELLLPSSHDIEGVRSSLLKGGYPAERTDGDVVTRDPWGTRLRLRASGAG